MRAESWERTYAADCQRVLWISFSTSRQVCSPVFCLGGNHLPHCCGRGDIHLLLRRHCESIGRTQVDEQSRDTHNPFHLGARRSRDGRIPPAHYCLFIGQKFVTGVISILIALVTVGSVLVVAVRDGTAISRFAAHESDEIILLTMFGAVLLVAGVAQGFQVSSAVGAFLVGIALSGPIVKQAHRLDRTVA